jgi:hypothetical protein
MSEEQVLERAGAARDVVGEKIGDPSFLASARDTTVHHAGAARDAVHAKAADEGFREQVAHAGEAVVRTGASGLEYAGRGFAFLRDEFTHWIAHK